MQHLHYFINTEIPQEVSFFSSNYSKLKSTMRMRGFPYEAKTQIISKIAEKAEERSYKTEIIHLSRDNTVCGIIIKDLSTGVYFDSENFKECDSLKANAAELFCEAKKIHDKQEEIYIKNTDFDRLDDMASVASQMLFFVNKKKVEEYIGNETHRFFGALTADGSINYIQNITAELKNRYFIKGRPGTGKSTFLKKLAVSAINAGYDVEIYHCSLDPKSIDMIVVREAGICVFDSTPPHEYFPERWGDGIIDIYNMCVKQGTDEKYNTELSILNQKYSETIDVAKKALKKYQEALAEREKMLFEMSQEDIYKISSDLIRSTFNI